MLIYCRPNTFIIVIRWKYVKMVLHVYNCWIEYFYVKTWDIDGVQLDLCDLQPNEARIPMNSACAGSMECLTVWSEGGGGCCWVAEWSGFMGKWFNMYCHMEWMTSRLGRLAFLTASQWNMLAVNVFDNVFCFFVISPTRQPGMTPKSLRKRKLIN